MKGISQIKMKHIFKFIKFLPYLLISILGIYALNFSMAIQPWAGSDTAVYYNMAQNIAAGNGFVTNYPSGRLSFVGLHPPFFSVIWSIFVQLQIPLITSIKILNSFFFAVLLIGNGLWMQRLTKNRWSGFLVSLLLLVNPHFFINFQNALSEPLYLFLAMLAFYLFVEGLLKPEKSVWWLLSSAVFAGLAAFTRFIGISSILLGCVAILLFLMVPNQKKWLLAVAYGIVASIPLLYWFFLKWFVYPTDTSRTVIVPQDFVHFSAKFFYGVVDTVIRWIPPALWISDVRVRRWLILAVLVLLTGIVIAVYFKHFKKLYKQSDPGILLASVSLLLVVSFLVIFFLSYVFSSISPDIDDRTLVLLIPTLLIAAITLLQASLSDSSRKKRLFALGLIAILLAGFLPAYTVNTTNLAREHHQTQEGYLQPKYIDSEFMHAISALPDNTKLISNQPALILLHAGRHPYEFSGFTCEDVSARSEIPFGKGVSEDDQRYRDGMLLAILNDDFDRLFYNCFSNNRSAHQETFLSASSPLVVTADGILYRYNPDAIQK